MKTLKSFATLMAATLLFATPLAAETFNLSLSVGGNATFFPEASQGFLVADTAGDGFQFLGSNSSYLLYGATTSANRTLWGADDVVVFANLGTGEFPDVGRGFDTIVLPYDSTALNPNWTSGDALILVWFPSGAAGNGAVFNHYRSDNANDGTIGFITPTQGDTDNIVAIGVTPTSANIALSTNEEFVVWLFEKIFLRVPERDEFMDYRGRLQPNGNLTESGLANEMLRSTAFANQDKPVYAAHYWLGILPANRDSVAAAINLVQENTALLAGWQPFGNSTAAPFGATFGMANATQSILANAGLQSGNASVVSLSNPAFVDWFLGQFDESGVTTDQKTQLTSFMTSHSPQDTRQGALVSFLSNYFASTNDAILGAAARWLLNDRWDPATNRDLSDAYLQLLLDPPVLSISANPPGGGTVTQNGTSTQNATHDVDTHVPIAATPSANYQFLNWSGNGVADTRNATTTVFLDNDIEITANFALILTVSYNTQGGSAIANGATTTGGSIASSPGTPTRAGYTFQGWFTAPSGSSAIAFPYTHGLTGNSTLFAQWTANALTVSYDSQDGSAIANGATKAGAAIASSPETPTRAGYTFNGWYGAPSGGSAIAFPYTHGQTGNFTLFAQWDEIISLSLSGNMSFGNVTLNQTSNRTLTITNNGTGNLTVSGISYPINGFSGNWSGVIAPSNSQNVTVSFKPTATISYSGNLTVQSDASSGVPSLALSGSGVSASNGSANSSPGGGGGGGSPAVVEKSKKKGGKGKSASANKSGGSNKKSEAKKSSGKKKKSEAKKSGGKKKSDSKKSGGKKKKGGK